MIVDDDEMLGRALARGLRALGNVCHVERSVDEALHTLAAARPDVLLTDFDLAASCTGADLACWSRNAFRVEVLLMSAEDPALVRRALDDVGLGDVVVLPKPFSAAELVARLHGPARHVAAR